MPKTGDRRFQNLLKAFGVVGAADDLRLPLAGAVAPVVNVDEYDPAGQFGIAVLSPAVVGSFSFLEVRAKPWARLMSFNNGIFTYTLRRKSAFTAGGTPVVIDTASVPFSSYGTLPKFDMQIGSAVVALNGCQVDSSGDFPPILPLAFDGVLRMETTVTNSAIVGFMWFQEQRTD
jgi:hypothetical protein